MIFILTSPLAHLPQQLLAIRLDLSLSLFRTHLIGHFPKTEHSTVSFLEPIQVDPFSQHIQLVPYHQNSFNWSLFETDSTTPLSAPPPPSLSHIPLHLTYCDLIPHP